MTAARIAQILGFWFGDVGAAPDALARRIDLWFGNDPAKQGSFDEQIRRAFGGDVDAALRGELDTWAQSAPGRLALILLLDQFPRNMFRGSVRAFSGDSKALQLVTEGMKAGADLLLKPVERMFFYMPLQHAEDASAQNRGIDAFRRLASGAPEQLRELLSSGVRFAELHREIITRFGRFPHRNAALGRASTPAEREYLAGGASDFGQTPEDTAVKKE